MGFKSLLSRGVAVAVLIPLLLVACDDETTAPPAACSMSPFSFYVIPETVAETVSVSVTVIGCDGQLFSGGEVNFIVTSGNGTVSQASATTGVDGIAATEWTLGETSGAQTLKAALGNLFVSFRAEATAGFPASVQALATYSGTYQPGAELSQRAEFKVKDQYGNGVPGASVSFSASHGGSVDPAEATTTSDGRASTTWTLGRVNATQVLTATADPATPGTVQADAFDPCLETQTLSFDETAVGTLSTENCEIVLGGGLRHVDYLDFSLNDATAVVFTLSSDFGSPSFNLWGSGGFMGGLTADDGNELVYRAFLDTNPLTSGGLTSTESPESYRAAVYSGAGEVGGFSLLAAESDGQVENCEAWVTSGFLFTTQELSTTDCVLSAESWRDGTYYDPFLIYLERGESILVSQTSGEMDTYLTMYDWQGDHRSYDDDGGSGLNSLLYYTAPADNFYWILAGQFDDWEMGPYTLDIRPVTTMGPYGTPGTQSIGDTESPPSKLRVKGKGNR